MILRWVVLFGSFLALHALADHRLFDPWWQGPLATGVLAILWYLPDRYPTSGRAANRESSWLTMIYGGPVVVAAGVVLVVLWTWSQGRWWPTNSWIAVYDAIALGIVAVAVGWVCRSISERLRGDRSAA